MAQDKQEDSGKHKLGEMAQNNSGKRLNPKWVCQLMGVPTDWVYPSESERNRTDELRMLGNGVVPQTAAKAFLTLTTNIIQPKKI
jgi:site-specific DNA-cytosine methylase